MARRRLITRTVKTRTVTVLGIDTETTEPKNKEIIYTPPMNDPEKELKYVKTLGETDTYKIVAIVNRVDDKKTFGMEEQFFLEHAFPMTCGKIDIEHAVPMTRGKIDIEDAVPMTCGKIDIEEV